MDESAYTRRSRKYPPFSLCEPKRQLPGEISELVRAGQKLMIPPQHVYKIYGRIELEEWPIPKEYEDVSMTYIGGVGYTQGLYTYFDSPKLLTKPIPGKFYVHTPPAVLDLSEHHGLRINPLCLYAGGGMTDGMG